MEHKSAGVMIEADADFLYSKKEYLSAINLFDNLISDFPDTARYYYKRGKIKSAMGKNPEALADFNKSISLSDSSQKSYFIERAKLYQKDNEFDKALEDLKIAISIDPYCDTCLNQMGICYGHLYENDLAIEAFKAALELKTENIEYRKNLSIELTRQNKIDTALIVLNEGITKDSLSASLFFCRAITFLESGNRQNAKEDLRKCMQLSDKYETICQSQVHYYTFRNNLSAAVFLLSTMLEYHPGNPEINSEMALLKEYQNEIPEAIDYYYRALDLDPHNIDWLKKIARLLTIEQRYDESIIVFNNLIQHSETNTDYYLKRGYAYYKTKKPDLAKKDWQRALELGNNKAKEYLEVYFP